jgi:hypothetical protein
MGGKALKSVPTRRYTQSEFIDTWVFLNKILYRLNCRYNLIKSYSLKESYGDMDILVEYTDELDKEAKINQILEILTPEEVYRNKDIISLNFKDLQVDFMFVKSENYDICYHFFSFNDLGGFMGKIARSLRCKYGQNGLEFDIYNEDKSRKLFTINLSKDPKTIAEFLGFDYYRMFIGFDYRENIFEYVANSEFFRMATFDGSELRSDQRSRDMGRPMYQELLTYLKNNHKPDRIFCRPVEDFAYGRIEKFFGINIWVAIDSLRKEDEKRQRAKSKFNGRHVMEFYSIEGNNELKSLMNNFYSNNTVDFLFIINNDMPTIFKKFEEINKDLLKLYGINPNFKHA